MGVGYCSLSLGRMEDSGAALDEAIARSAGGVSDFLQALSMSIKGMLLFVTGDLESGTSIPKGTLDGIVANASVLSPAAVLAMVGQAVGSEALPEVRANGDVVFGQNRSADGITPPHAAHGRRADRGKQSDCPSGVGRLMGGRRVGKREAHKSATRVFAGHQRVVRFNPSISIR